MRIYTFTNYAWHKLYQCAAVDLEEAKEKMKLRSKQETFNHMDESEIMKDKNWSSIEIEAFEYYDPEFY